MMKPMEEGLKNQFQDTVDELIDLRRSVERHRAAINATIVDMNDDIQAYNNALENANSFALEWVSELERYQKEHKRDWDTTDAGKHHKEMMTEWETIVLDPIDQIEEIELDDMKHPDELGALPLPR